MKDEPIGLKGALAEIMRRNAPSENNLSGGVEDKPSACGDNSITSTGKKAIGTKLEEVPVPASITTAAQKLPRYKFVDENKKHLHTLDGRPLLGTSSVIDILAKHGLVWWVAEEAALVCFEAGIPEPVPTLRDELAEVKQLEGYAKKKAMDALQKKYPLLKSARYAHKNKKEEAAQPGTDMHEELENYINDCIYDNAGTPIAPTLDDSEPVQIFADWAIKNVIEFLWSEAHCYSERLWVGGICDFGAMLRTGGWVIGDFKSSREAYFGHFVQAGGYALQIGENGLLRADGTSISTGIRYLHPKALVVFPFGGKCEPRIETNVEDFKRAFEGAIAIYKLQQKYDT
jgi:hypothetical protein